MTAALALLVLFIPAEMPPPVFLPDLVAFGGCTRDCAVVNQKLTNAHDRYLSDVLPYESPALAAWSLRQNHVACAWYFLADALDDAQPTYKRAAALKKLRDRIGDTAYFAGQMPDPTPGYLYPPFPPKK